jgi:hypothetical protein
LVFCCSVLHISAVLCFSLGFCLKTLTLKRSHRQKKIGKHYPTSTISHSRVQEESSDLHIKIVCKNTVPFQIMNMEKYEQMFSYKVTEIQNTSVKYTEWKLCVCSVVHHHISYI